MRLDSINGKGAGKTGNRVYYVNHGVQCDREYTSHVANPNTPLQVGQRSRFKLASQVSAALAPVIAFPRKGILSPRNLFVKRNMGYFYSTPDGAQVSYQNLQLVQGNLGLPKVAIDRSQGVQMTIYLDGTTKIGVDRVIYSLYTKSDEGALLFVGSFIKEYDPEDPLWSIQMTPISGDLLVYAYGMRDNSQKAKARYGQYQVNNGVDLAQLICNRTLSMTDYTFTETRGAILYDGDDETPDISALEAPIYITVNGSGTVKCKVGDGEETTVTSSPLVEHLNDHIKLTAVPGIDQIFLGWYNNGEQSPFSTSSSIEFDLTGLRDIIASFAYHSPGLE